jgi:tellurite resistance protein
VTPPDIARLAGDEPTDKSVARVELPPIRAFTCVMGTGGLALTWQKAESVLQFAWPVHSIPMAMSVAIFMAIVISILKRTIQDASFLSDEFRDSASLNYFAAAPISLVVFSAATATSFGLLSTCLLAIGASLHLTLTIVCLSRWISDESVKITHLNPSWFMPVVGNVLIPIPAVMLGYIELGWFFFTVGIFFWPILLTLTLNRLFFFGALAPGSRPTVFILLSPPAVGFVAYVMLTGGSDRGSDALFFITLITIALLLPMVPSLLRLDFSLSWWSFSFPTTAAATAVLTYLEHHGSEVGLWALGGLALAVATIVVLALFAATAAGLLRDKRQPDRTTRTDAS